VVILLSDDNAVKVLALFDFVSMKNFAVAFRLKLQNTHLTPA